jgi:hypothetical protein
MRKGPLGPKAALAAALLACAIGGHAQAPALPAPLAEPATAVRLMVTKEVTTRHAKVGDRFRLRVDEAVTVGATVIPVGAPAWGEVTSVAGTGAAGKSGRLGARLLYIDLPSGQLPLSGTRDVQGGGNTAGVVLGMVVWGPLALLNKGDNGKLKAGEIIVGYVGVPGSNAANSAQLLPTPM